MNPITYMRPDPTQPGWCDTGEAVKPSNQDIAVGWPPSQIPPSRQEFNWLDKQQDAAYKYLCQIGIAQWDERENYRGFGLAIGSNGSVYWSLQPSIGIDPVHDNTGAWELTTIRLSDADARYVMQAGGMFLTQSQADGRYQLIANMGQYLTRAQGDSLYLTSSSLGGLLTGADAASIFVTRADLSAYDQTLRGIYLTVVDAANRYLSKSEAAQTYLSNASANGLFAQTYADLQWYAQGQANNANASARAWMEGQFPPYDWQEVSNGSTMNGTWYMFGARAGVQLCMGSGLCQEGDTIQPPRGFVQDNMRYRGWVCSVPPQLPSLPAIGGFVFNFGGGAQNGVVVDCYYIKQNDGNQRRGRGFTYGAWTGHGARYY